MEFSGTRGMQNPLHRFIAHHNMKNGGSVSDSGTKAWPILFFMVTKLSAIKFIEAQKVGLVSEEKWIHFLEKYWVCGTVRTLPGIVVCTDMRTWSCAVTGACGIGGQCQNIRIGSMFIGMSACNGVRNFVPITVLETHNFVITYYMRSPVGLNTLVCLHIFSWHVLLNNNKSTTRWFQVTPQNQYVGSDLKASDDLAIYRLNSANTTLSQFGTKVYSKINIKFKDNFNQAQN